MRSAPSLPPPPPFGPPREPAPARRFSPEDGYGTEEALTRSQPPVETMTRNFHGMIEEGTGFEPTPAHTPKPSQPISQRDYWHDPLQ